MHHVLNVSSTNKCIKTDNVDNHKQKDEIRSTNHSAKSTNGRIIFEVHNCRQMTPTMWSRIYDPSYTTKSDRRNILHMNQQFINENQCSSSSNELNAMNRATTFISNGFGLWFPSVHAAISPSSNSTYSTECSLNDESQCSLSHVSAENCFVLSRLNFNLIPLSSASTTTTKLVNNSNITTTLPSTGDKKGKIDNSSVNRNDSDKERFERLFREIDVDDNGFIDFNDLVHTLERKGIKGTDDNVKDVFERTDSNLDGDIDIVEFVSYCLENEKKLHILFKDIDLNDDGKVDSNELVQAFQRAGIEVDHDEVLRLVHRIKQESGVQGHKSTVELDFEEFRDFLLLHPTDSLSNLMRSWRHGTFVDLGEDGLIPVDFSENEIRTGMWWRHLIAGGVAGAVSRTATAPLDRLKVFLQVRGAEFNGLGVCLRHMIQEGGVVSLWRGNGINVLKIAPETAIKFMAFDQMKRWIHANKKSGEITIMERFLAGSFAGAISQTVIYPMEVLKTRFCLRSTGQYSGILDAARKIYANGGMRNFYRGYVPNLIGIIPYAGIDLTIYETLKKMYLKHNSMEEAPIYVCLTCGTLSSTFGQIASYPLALVRTRMQSESGKERSSMVGMFRNIWKQEGTRGLYRGITANIMKVAPAVSISYVVYENTRRPLGATMS
ncbi:hypothetical protein BLOT_007143 [Blomia tropicalis]|nr:hypothetical protein BLOT_007143 [Blomia tropicalis]